MGEAGTDGPETWERAWTPLREAIAGRTTREEPLPADAVRAAVALVLVGPPRDCELLLIRRARREGDPWSGHMALPGGRKQASDADLVETARRETREETGVVLPPHLGALDDLRPTRSRNPRIVVRPFVFALPARPPVTPEVREVAYARWVPLRELATAGVTEPVTLMGRDLVVPGYRLGSDFVWGMTHRILAPFLELVH
jgi:8-oxo-dGTP pyrophosphatase MutT (NUDIX family)